MAYITEVKFFLMANYMWHFHGLVHQKTKLLISDESNDVAMLYIQRFLMNKENTH